MNVDGSTVDSRNDTSTVRPRKGRLISYNDEADSDSALDLARASPQSRIISPYSSRGASPVPRAHLSRQETSSRAVNAGTRNDTVRGSAQSSGLLSPSGTSLGTGLWDSWSSLQGIASSLLGSDTAHSENNKPRARSPLGVMQWRKASKSGSVGTPTQWGPKSGTSQIAAGSKEERQSLVQAKKREVLMRADADQTFDTKGRYKRRGSDGRWASETRQEPPDEDALVYIHRVKPDDTLAGVMIKYGCQPAVFRKVNRLWPNDNIQIRKIVLLPVDACSVRGKRVEDDLMDLVQDHPEVKPDIVINQPGDSEEQVWKHEYYVSIAGIPGLIEIGRVPRRTLGFFPPSRRKSITSDLGRSPGSRNVSLDLSRQISDRTSHSTHMNGSPSRSIPSRQRTSSSASQSQTPYFMSRLRGPGGVGNLTGRSAIAPGPAPDSLNKIFAPHLPNVEPPDSLSFLVEDDDGIGSQASRTSSLGTSGLENLGGAVESWLRKMGTKVAQASSTLGTSPAGSGTRSSDLAISGWMPSGMGGDLIELGETPLDFQDDGEGILGRRVQTNGLSNKKSSSSGFQGDSEDRQPASIGDADPAVRGRLINRGKSRTGSSIEVAGKSKDD